MTQQEYEKVCQFISETMIDLWITPFQVIKCITPMGADKLKTKIKTLVKGNKSK